MRGWLHTAVLVLGLTVIRAACTRTCVSVADCEPHFLGCDASHPGGDDLSSHYAPVGRLAANLRRQGAPALLFAQWCLLGYGGSVIFHMVPYRTNWSFNLALMGDLIGVALGSLAPLMVWNSSVAPPTPNPWTPESESVPRAEAEEEDALGLGAVKPLELAAAVGVLLALCIAAMVGSTVWRGCNVLDEYRWERLSAQGAILLLQTFAEFWCCWVCSPRAP